MSWTNRSRAPRSSVLAGLRAAASFAFAVMLALGSAVPARAQSTSRLWFAGTWFVPERSQMRDGVLAVATGDPALGRFLAHLGATLSYDPAQRYVLIVASDHRSVTFAVGDRRYSVDGAVETAPFAPYVSGADAYLPFLALAKALYVDPVAQGDTTVLQPQIAALDVRSQGRVTTVDLHGSSTLRFKRLTTGVDGRLSLEFLGTASTLDPERDVTSEALSEISIAVSGSVRNPATIVTFRSVAGAPHVLLPTTSPNEIVLAFAPPGVALRGTPVPASGIATVAQAGAFAPRATYAPQSTAANSSAGGVTPSGDYAPPAEPSNSEAAGTPVAQTSPEAGSSAPARVVNATLDPNDDGITVRLWFASTDPIAYEWHRLPDDRWYVDFKNATLAVPSQDQTLQNDAITSVRLKQAALDPSPVVRLAFTLTSPRVVNLVPFDGGISVSVDRLDDLSSQRVGMGTIGGGQVAAGTPADQPMDETPAPVVAPTPWKFSPPPVSYGARNPRLIVLDPGHGGSDTGAMQHGLIEKELTLDISQRLRSVLVSRGWLVEMTRATDTDVFEPNDSAHDELQARCDIANHAGARMFISVHVNSFTSGGLNGTTTYYYKGIDLALARAIHERLTGTLGTADDGVRKENFYVIHHTTMPAVLVETAFMSNANDAQLLRSPAWREKVAVAIADGVQDYAGAPPAHRADGSDDTSDLETAPPPEQ